MPVKRPTSRDLRRKIRLLQAERRKLAALTADAIGRLDAVQEALGTHWDEEQHGSLAVAVDRLREDHRTLRTRVQKGIDILETRAGAQFVRGVDDWARATREAARLMVQHVDAAQGLNPQNAEEETQTATRSDSFGLLVKPREV